MTPADIVFNKTYVFKKTAFLGFMASLPGNSLQHTQLMLALGHYGDDGVLGTAKKNMQHNLNNQSVKVYIYKLM